MVNERFWSKVNKTDDCWLWTAHTDEDGYGRFNLKGVAQLAHRVAYALKVGPVPAGRVLDHACHTRNCIRPDLKHVRPTTQKKNTENRARLNSNNKSGYRGVSWSKTANKWLAQVGHKGKSIPVGYFTDVQEAAEAVRLKRLELFTNNELDR